MGSIQISSMVFGIVRIAVAQSTLLSEGGKDLSETSLSVVLVVSSTGHSHPALCRYTQFCVGKYWHRHRRPRPVEYSTDPEFHIRQQAKGGNDEGNSKAVSYKKKKSQVVVDEVKYEEADAVEDTREEEGEVAPTTTANVAKLEAQTASVLPHPLDDRPLSPVSTASSASETPLVEQVKMNGGSSGYNSNPSTPAKTTREVSERPENGVETASEVHGASRSVGATVCPLSPTSFYIGLRTDDRVHCVQPSTAPEWLKRATENLRAKYPGDEFDVVLRKIKPDKPADWRIRCHDCPMMVWSMVILVV